MRCLIPLMLLGLTAPVGAEILEVQVSNRSSSSATVTWFTAEDADGCVNYGLTTALGESTCDSRPDDNVHQVQLTGLLAESTYYFEVVSDGETDDNGGAYYTLDTAEVGSGIPYVVFGDVWLYGESDPAIEALVVVEVRSGSGTSTPLSTLTDPGGFWSLNLGNLKTPAGLVFAYAEGDTIDVYAAANEDETAETLELVSGSSPQNTGTLVLSSATAVPDDSAFLSGLALWGAAPNPFGDTTVIQYSLANAHPAELAIFDPAGRQVRRLPIQSGGIGLQSITWDGRNDAGKRLSPGVYYMGLVVGGTKVTRAVTVLR